ncbi:MAG TPA: SpoIIE family protein phosphatase [Terriglobia bacterium]|nr:SpoIIE family protein phosphatase [Terriglobia bacterium]
MAGSLPHLLVRDASGNEREVEISRTPFTMGRQSDNDLVLLDSRISRHHAKLFQDERGMVIEDAESRHGTFVNNERITTCTLKSGDHISLGVTDAYQLTFVEEQVALPRLLEQMGKVKESPAPQLQHLGLLLQMAQMLHRAPALEEVLTMLVDSAIQLTDAERGMLFLIDDGGDLKLRLARGRGGVYLHTDLENYSHAAVQRVVDSGREDVVLEEEVSGRAANETAIIQAGVRGVVAVPLQKHPMMEVSSETMTATAPELLGVLYLDSRSRATSVTGLDRQVLQTFAVEGATVIENARLFRIAREQERMQYQFSLARNIQQGLLPRELPKSKFFQIVAVSMPCQTVGGDYYDVIRLPGDRFGLTVADVSGKGLPAAMLAATLQGAFAAVAAGDPGLEDLFNRVNDFLCERTPAEMFATIFYGVLDRFGKFTFVNAGHATPLVARANGQVTRLDSSNFPLGFFPGVKFTVESTQLEYGDLVLVFSDGVTEAQNSEDDLYGESRLKEFLENTACQAAPELCEKVIAAVQNFVGAAPQADDITLTVLRFGPS